MSNKKIIVVIVVFIVCSLFIYSFANPARDMESSGTNGNEGVMNSDGDDENSVNQFDDKENESDEESNENIEKEDENKDSDDSLTDGDNQIVNGSSSGNHVSTQTTVSGTTSANSNSQNEGNTKPNNNSKPSSGGENTTLGSENSETSSGSTSTENVNSGTSSGSTSPESEKPGTSSGSASSGSEKPGTGSGSTSSENEKPGTSSGSTSSESEKPGTSGGSTSSENENLETGNGNTNSEDNDSDNDETIGMTDINVTVEKEDPTFDMKISSVQSGNNVLLQGLITKKVDNVYAYSIPVVFKAQKIISKDILKNAKVSIGENKYGFAPSTYMIFSNIENADKLDTEKAYFTFELTIQKNITYDNAKPLNITMDWGDGNPIIYNIDFRGITIN